MSKKIKLTCCVLLATGAGIASTDLKRGRRIDSAVAVLDGVSLMGRDRFLVDWEQHVGNNSAHTRATSPQEAQALVALWLDQAAASPRPIRALILTKADTLLDQARTIRPAAPAATVLQVRLDLLRYGKPQSATITSFSRSYREAGFLRDEGLWRLAFAAVYWSRLAPDTRAAAVDEAVWLARLDGQLRNAVDQLVSNTPLAVPVELRLLN